jgi:hypothetical protein
MMKIKQSVKRGPMFRRPTMGIFTLARFAQMEVSAAVV